MEGRIGLLGRDGHRRKLPARPRSRPRAPREEPGGREHPPAAPGEGAGFRHRARRRPVRPRPLQPSSARRATATPPRSAFRGNTGRAARRRPALPPPNPPPGPPAPLVASGLHLRPKRRGPGPANPGRPGIRAPERPGRPDSHAAPGIIPSRDQTVTDDAPPTSPPALSPPTAFGLERHLGGG